MLPPRPADRAAAVKAIQKLGGWVAYDYEIDEQHNLIPNAEPPGPAAWGHTVHPLEPLLRGAS